MVICTLRLTKCSCVSSHDPFLFQSPSEQHQGSVGGSGAAVPTAALPPASPFPAQQSGGTGACQGDQTRQARCAEEASDTRRIQSAPAEDWPDQFAARPLP